ncbi:MAG: hypothetical protein ACRCT8_08915 [Lacipirellulaceae bacterium]
MSDFGTPHRSQANPDNASIKSAPLVRRLRFESLERHYALSFTPLSNGEEVTREVGLEDPFDGFHFQVAAGDRVIVSVGEGRAVTGNTVNLLIRRPDGSFLAEDFCSENATISFTAPVSGEYRAFVSERGNDADFDYRIRLVNLNQPFESAALRSLRRMTPPARLTFAPARTRG